MLKGTIAAALLLSVATISGAQASGNELSNDAQEVTSVETNKEINKNDARKIIKNYLKSNKKYKKLHVGKIEKSDGIWKVGVKARNNIKVATTYVNSKTGEITFKR